MGFASKLFAGGEVSERLVEQTEESTFVEVKNPLRVYTSFAWRLALSSVIATGGIAGGSTAVIIGAMLVAPLMQPMVGTMLAIVRGKGKAIARTLAITVAGMLLSIGVAMAVSAIIPVHVDMATNEQVLSRISPRLVDLAVALAAGFVAALSVIREDIPDTAPVVAIAVSIVPPLCVVGIALFEGDISAACGALLLFVTNYFAIQTTALLVFVVVGLGKTEPNGYGDRTRRIWYALAIAGLIAVFVPLAITSARAVAHTQTEQSAFSAADTWLEGSGYEARSLKLVKNELNLEIAGEGEVPSTDAYLSLLKKDGVQADSVNVIVLQEMRVGR